jgi:hypothetical protein
LVWGRRIDPARVVVLNVPTPPSGHRWGDIVLHDGVPDGERRIGDQVCGMSDELERWRPSEVPTLEVQVSVGDPADGEALAEIFDAAGLAAQDWSRTVRRLCRRCSERQPHEHAAGEAGAERPHDYDGWEAAVNADEDPPPSTSRELSHRASDGRS